jgi:uncharacterized protein (TIGR02231 family)
MTFENLPVALMDQSLSASGLGVAGASILDVAVENVFTPNAPNERVKQLEDQVKTLQKQRRLLDDRGKIIEQQRAFVERMLQSSTPTLGTAAPTAGDRAVNRSSLDEWQKLYGYAEETFSKIAAEQVSLDAQREELQAKQTVVEQQLNELRGARGRQSKSVKVRLAAQTAGRLEVSIQYAIPGAGWTPSYDARLRSADRAVELSYFGVVRNATGEDWNDVDLTLSTARPSMGGAAPELRAWVADVVRPLPAQSNLQDNADRRSGTFSNRDGLARGVDETQLVKRAERLEDSPMFSKFAQDEEAGIFAAEVESGVSSATFKIPVKVRVPGNNISQKVAVNSIRLPANLQYQATPKTLEAAFLTAKANNTSDYPMLAGPMNTFLDDTFVAVGNLKTVMPGEKLDIALGVDDGFMVKRRVVNRFKEDTGFIGKSRKVTYEIVVIVTNNKSTTEKFLFKEPTPVSRDEKVKVQQIVPAEKEIGTVANPKEVTREEDGKLVWRVDLKPGEKREFPLKLSVEYPGDVVVTGLE